jgi:hypothetical protein
MRTVRGFAVTVALYLSVVSVVGSVRADDPGASLGADDPAAGATGTPSLVGADLATTIAADTGEFDLDVPFTFTVAVINNGPADASGVRLSISFSRGAVYGRPEASQGTCGRVGDVVTCDLSGLAPGGMATTAVRLRPIAANYLEGTATVIGNEADPYMANNKAAHGVRKSGWPIVIDPVRTPV